ncbi:ParA family protein [Litoribrevibacter albus]|uniref:CobQ/CobB/MinD/ParA nucleotide binding domain-containing protein n=1 Tax=Litoribrevibacter albus TaxID=1473156 RepID=A0AA37SDG7_9GAMM|nr:ParA family protein [Litoribrevibacter albus]GLQ33113.1 hypothetical protein GCM10007876_35920 [Litoribrevibacter albus]
MITQQVAEMARQYHRKSIPRILITNAKGGSGKTTIATNLAAHYAQDNDVTIMDFDSQQSSTSWLTLRPNTLNPIQLQSGFKLNHLNQTRSWQLRSSIESDLIILDTPAAMPDFALEEVVSCSDVILIPVLPSMIDIKAVEHFIYHLLQARAYRQNPIPVGIIANRVRRNTKIFATLSQFLKELGLPVISILRDTQQYIKAFEQGMGLVELDRIHPNDNRSMHLITEWIDSHLFQQPPDSSKLHEVTVEINSFIAREKSESSTSMDTTPNEVAAFK